MPLRTERQALANELLERLLVSAHRYGELAAWAGDGAGEQLAAIAREREALGARLGEAIRRSGDLPDGVDPERLELGDLALEARRLVTGTAKAMKKVVEREDDALLTLADAMALETPELRAIALAIRTQIAATRARLSARA